METDAGPGGLTARRRRLLAATAAILTVLAAATTTGGYLALRAHRDSQAGTLADAAALAAAKDCLAATQPVDVTALPASQRKLDECATGAFGTQAGWYSAILTEAYQAQNMHVRLPEMDAAVERTNDDGSIVALVVFRAAMSQQGMPDRENSYRIRVTMVRRDGQYKISQLDQVAK
ncbi:Mce protein [Mycobacterium sp.]|uniref:Mce protein n=1 Tax=Mycobacterium sp. TaxID=1785 RepID=UPI002579D8C8|nr:Mce protein [Mycobacterium sp.]